jgi:phenylpropionate dioxygenase-like ring-hydroxylating dioxygenase large terminal subunit
MLSAQNNERLAHIGPGTEMGTLMRRYWMPFLLSGDIPGADSDPVPIKLLGESLVAFRNTAGQVGLVDRLCAHRNADLFFGRNEEHGLRCTYHGWKYDVEGKCLDMPSEAADSNFKDKIQLKAYPVKERAGVLWTYMGPKEQMQPLPEFEWARVAADHRYVSWNFQENNYAQAIEGGIDTVHSVYLHSAMDSHRRLSDWQATGRGSGDVAMMYRTRVNPPKLQTLETDFGLIIGGRYPGDEVQDYWRFNLFWMPFYTAPPGGGNQKMMHAFVPIDDVTTARWSFAWSTTGRPLPARQVADLRKGQGVHAQTIPGTHWPVRNMRNDYLIDREEQRHLTFTGIKGTGEQDFSVQEGMGQISDRTREHLGITDIGIIAMRRMLLNSAAAIREGSEPRSARSAEAYRVRPGQTMIPNDADWASHENLKEAIAATY